MVTRGVIIIHWSDFGNKKVTCLLLLILFRFINKVSKLLVKYKLLSYRSLPHFLRIDFYACVIIFSMCFRIRWRKGDHNWGRYYIYYCLQRRIFYVWGVRSRIHLQNEMETWICKWFSPTIALFVLFTKQLYIYIYIYLYVLFAGWDGEQFQDRGHSF